MKNAYFSEDDLPVLLSCSKWHLVSSANSELPPVKPDNEYLGWLT
ncbi:MAG: hypothetical protein WCI51_23055 [Lentisphaerota bacterium]